MQTDKFEVTTASVAKSRADVVRLEAELSALDGRVLDDIGIDDRHPYPGAAMATIPPRPRHVVAAELHAARAAHRRSRFSSTSP